MRSKEVELAIERINKVREKQFNQFEQRGKINITIGVNDLRAIDTVLNYISELEEELDSARRKNESLKNTLDECIHEDVIIDKMKELEAMAISQDIYYQDVLKLFEELLGE